MGFHLGSTDTTCDFDGILDGNYRFVLCGEGEKEAFDRLKSSLNARGGGKDLICGSISASKMQIEEII